MLDPVQPREFENSLLDAVFVRHGFEESAQNVLGGLYNYYRCYAVALIESKSNWPCTSNIARLYQFSRIRV